MSCDYQSEPAKSEDDHTVVETSLAVDDVIRSKSKLSVVSASAISRRSKSSLTMIDEVTISKHSEQKATPCKQMCIQRIRSCAIACGFATLGALIAFRLQHGQQFNSVVASAITGVLANSFGAPFREIMFSGSFAGMSAHVDINGPFSYIDMVCVGIVTGIVFEVLKPHFVGVGGKLGTIAFFSGTCVALVKLASGHSWDPLRLEEPWSGWTWQLASAAVIFSGVGCAVTVGMMQKTPPMSSTTLASSTTGLLANVFLAMPPDDMLSPSEFVTMTCFAYTGSFVAMSAVGRVGGPWRIVLAGVMSGFVLLALWPLCPGVGGKFGFSAFVSVLVVERIPKMSHDLSKEATKENAQVEAELADKGGRSSLRSLRNSLQALRQDVGDVDETCDEASMRDWLTWVPARCWHCAARFLAAGGDEEAAVSALKEAYGHDLNLDRSMCLALLAEAHAPQSSLEAVMNASLAAERCVAPPPPHPGISDPTALFALTLFKAVSSTTLGIQERSSEDCLPQSVVEPLLKSLGAVTIGLDQEVSAESFAEHIEMRVMARGRAALAQDRIHAGALMG
eukprot:TRINITY_DN10611_c0_g1_i1.p1 TRINITY_DN10611_c0_g1~~TRINITY_DN10611_c0_g1_i1.p1  ORF type:complete len:565 (-),score=83.68 TRINITY_DN10611_c0_g1_i1:320-2014(-)